jgi:hypothetical protein
MVWSPRRSRPSLDAAHSGAQPQLGPVIWPSRSPLGSLKLWLPADGTELVLELGQYPDDHLENSVPLVEDFVSFQSNFSTTSVQFKSG